MAKARKIPGLDSGASFRDAAASAIEVRSEEVFSFADRNFDAERVHDMRVATRRLRAALEIFAICFPGRELKALLREVKLLADALGERRDPDVQIMALERLQTEFGNGERTGVNGLAAGLCARQAEGDGKVQEAIARAREIRLEERLAELAQEAAGQ